MIIDKAFYKKWYYLLSNQYNMFQYVHNREFMLKSVQNLSCTTRHLQVRSVQSFQWWYKRIETLDDDKSVRDYFNKYYSLATFEPFPLTLEEQNAFGRGRREAVKEHFTHGWSKYLKDFDFLIDIDAPTIDFIMIAYSDALKIARYLDLHDCPYSFRYSGKGFHVLIPNVITQLRKQDQFPLLDTLIDVKSPQSLMKLYAKFLNKLKFIFSDFVDDTIADFRRVTKIPYSLAIYQGTKGIHGYVCFEFQKDEIDSFTKKLINPQEWLVDNKLFKRKSYVFNEGGSPIKLFKKMKFID